MTAARLRVSCGRALAGVLLAAACSRTSATTGSEAKDSSAAPTALGSFLSLDFDLLASVNCEETLNGCAEGMGVNGETNTFYLEPGDPAKNGLSFQMTAEEGQRIQELVAAPAFQNLLKAPVVCDTELRGIYRGIFALKYPGDVVARWMNNQQDCVFADRTQVPEDNPVYQVYLALREMKEKRVICPPWVNPGPITDFDLTREQLPLSFSCYLCEGRCLPEGSDAAPTLSTIPGTTPAPSAPASAE